MTNWNYVLSEYNNIEKTINQINDNKQFSQREIIIQNLFSLFKKGVSKQWMLQMVTVNATVAEKRECTYVPT